MNRELRSLIVGTIATHPSAAPEEIAQLVANNIHQADMRTYIRDLLVAPVRTITAEERRHEKPPPKPTSAPSPKLADRRTWWQQELARDIYLAAGARKPLADCTVADLRIAIKECDGVIGRMEDRMSLYRHLIGVMTQRGAGRVRELPEQQARQARSA